MNVQSIHNATFAASCPPAVLAQARTLANYHEFNIFSSTNMSSIQNGSSHPHLRFIYKGNNNQLVPGQTILPTIIDSLARISNATDPLKFASISISYKPFISLFNMMGLAQSHPELAGIGMSYF